MQLDCILGSGNPGWVLGTQPKWVGPPNLADVLGRTKYPNLAWVPNKFPAKKGREYQEKLHVPRILRLVISAISSQSADELAILAAN
jgi:hypothetical protein